MPVFLSPDWIARLAASLAAVPIPGRESFAPFTLHHVVVPTPGAAAPERGYAVRCADTGFIVREATVPVAGDVVFRTDYPTAAALHRGELSAQEALESGRLSVSGRIDRITGARKLLVVLEDAGKELRATTTYEPAH